MNVNNWLIKADVVTGLYSIDMESNAINHVVLVKTWIIRILNAKKDWLIY